MADYNEKYGKEYIMYTEPHFRVRLRNVVRSGNQIKENMLNADPKSPGLVAYYKFNGDINDSSPNGYNPTDYSAPSFTDLENPVEIG